MLFHVVRHEWRNAWRSRTIVVLGLLVGALTVGTAIAGIQRSTQEEQQRQRYQSMVEAQWDAQPDRHPHRVSHYGFLVFRPRPTWSAFDGGLEAYAGTSLFLEAHRQNVANFSEAHQSDGILRFGHLTPAVVLQVVLPLAIFVVGATSVTREREAGTWAMLLCQGVSPRTLLLGKLAGLLAVFGALVAPGAALAAIIGLASAADAGWDAQLRLVGLTAAHLAFLTTCGAIAVTISAWQGTSRGALLTLVTLWLIGWVAVPRAVATVAQVAYAAPSRAAFDAAVEADVRRLGDSHDPNDPRFLALRESYLERFGVASIDQLPMNYNGVVMQEGEKHTAEAYATHVERLWQVFSDQLALVDAVAWVNPYLAMRRVSMTLAGVDAEHVRHFDDAAEAYRYGLIQYLNELHADEVEYARDRYAGGSGNDAPTRQRVSRAHWERAPEFRYQPPSASWAMGTVTASVCSMALWTWAAMALLLVGASFRMS